MNKYKKIVKNKNENNKNRIDNGVFAVSVHRGGVLVQPRHKACKNARKADDEALQLHAERPQTMKKAPPLGSFFNTDLRIY